MDQLKTIFRALGTPTEEDWPVRRVRPLSRSFPARARVGAASHHRLPNHTPELTPDFRVTRNYRTTFRSDSSPRRRCAISSPQRAQTA